VFGTAVDIWDSEAGDGSGEGCCVGIWDVVEGAFSMLGCHALYTFS